MSLLELLLTFGPDDGVRWNSKNVSASQVESQFLETVTSHLRLSVRVFS